MPTMIFDFIAVAAGFAGRRADTAHHRGEGVGFCQATPGVFLPGHGRFAVGAERRLFDPAHDVEVAADVLARGAGTLAGRRGLDVGRALVAEAGLEDFVLPAFDLVAVLVAAEGQLFGLVFSSGGHAGLQ
jgi:hypothetical protein